MPNEEVTKTEGTTVQSNVVSTPSTPSVTETTMKIDPNDKNVTSEDLKNFIQKESAKAVSNVKPPEKDIAELNKPTEVKEEKPTEPAQRVFGEEKKEEVKPLEPKVTEIVTPSLQEQVAEMVKAAIEKQSKPVEKEEEVVEPELTAEDITPEILADPAKTSEYIIKATNQMVKKEVAKAVKEITKTTLEPFVNKIKPVTEKIERDTVTNHQGEAIKKFPEFGTDKEFISKVKTYINENPDTVDAWVAKGINPFIKVSQIIKSEGLDNLLKEARDAGIKEGEERSKTAVKAFAEGGGKPTIDKPVDVDKMSAEELAKYLPHKIK